FAQAPGPFASLLYNPCAGKAFSKSPEELMVSPYQIAMFAPNIALPDGNATFLMVLRWIHFLAGITWIGLLYFFNLVNVPFMKELDAPTKGKVIPSLMPRALWWFRWAAVVTAVAGRAYWGEIVGAEAHNGGGSPGAGMGRGSLVWASVVAMLYVRVRPGKGVVD